MEPQVLHFMHVPLRTKVKLPQAPQNASHGGAVIERREKYSVGQAFELLIRRLAAGGRGGRYIHARSRMGGAQSANQFDARKNLAHRDGVKPNGSATRRLNGGGKESQALGEAGEIFAFADSPVQ